MTIPTELNASDRAVAEAVALTMRHAAQLVVAQSILTGKPEPEQEKLVHTQCRLVLEVAERYAMTLPRPLRREFFLLCGAYESDVDRLVERNIKGEDFIAAERAKATS